MIDTLFRKRLRPAWALLAILALFAASMAFAPVRAWAADLLGLFRVQQIAVLPVDNTRFSELNNDSTLGRQLGQMLSDSVTVSKEPGDPVAVASAEEASQIAGFTVRLSEDWPAPAQITVQGGTAFEMVMDRERAQALVDQAGRGDLRLPASLDGARIAVDIPAAVSAAYGDCPTPAEAEARDVSWSRLQGCIMLAQIPSPTVTAPPDLNVEQLAQIGLQFTGMTADEARAFSESVDWTSTLVVPIPRNGHSYRQVSVDGVTGTLILRHSDDGLPARYTLLWVRQEIVYAVAGFGDPEVGIALADSLK